MVRLLFPPSWKSILWWLPAWQRISLCNSNHETKLINERKDWKPGGYASLCSGKTFISGKVKAKELTYNGRYQELVETETAANGGTIVYGEEEGGPFTSTVPTGKDPGNYTVFYKVQGDANHEDSGVESVRSVIAKKEFKNSAGATLHSSYHWKSHCPTATLIPGVCHRRPAVSNRDRWTEEGRNLYRNGND